MANGGRAANLSVATSESWNDKDSGERREHTDWHRVVIFNDTLAEIAEPSPVCPQVQTYRPWNTENV